jgi:hypothetical protein
METTTQRQVAAAFGTDPVTVWRQDRALRDNGVAGLVPARKGPKGPSKLTPELAQRIRELDTGGMTLTAIATQCGVSTFAVRTALGRVPARPAARAARRRARNPLAGSRLLLMPLPIPARRIRDHRQRVLPADGLVLSGGLLSGPRLPNGHREPGVLFGSQERRHPASR